MEAASEIVPDASADAQKRPRDGEAGVAVGAEPAVLGEAGAPAETTEEPDAKRARETPAVKPEKLAVGAGVEARWDGGPNWYIGTIAAVHVNGDEVSYDVTYQDGDFESGVAADLVRAVPTNAAAAAKTEGLREWLKEREFSDTEVAAVCGTAGTVEDLLLATRDERASMMRDWKSQPRQRLEREIAIASGIAASSRQQRDAQPSRPKESQPSQPCCVCGCDDEEDGLLRCDGLSGHCNATAHALCVGLKKANATWYCAACRDAQEPKAHQDEPRRLVVHATAARGRAPSEYAGSVSATVDPASLSRESCDAWGPEDYDTLKNFPRARGPRRNCVMCGRAAPEQCSIPKQNKDVCDACSKAFWRHLKTTTCFKWCKGCKRFRSLPAFATKLVASKCDACRERGREGYQRSKQKLLEGS